MTTPQNPGSSGAPGQGDPWSAGTPQADPGGYPAQPYPQTSGDPQSGGYQQGGYPQSGGYQQGGYPQSGGYQQAGNPQSGGYPQSGYPQAGYPQAGYPVQPGQPGYGMPAYPGGPMGGYPAALPPAPQRPGTVAAAFWLWMLAAAISVVSVVLVFTSGVWEDAIRAAGIGETINGVPASTVVNTAKTIFIVVGLVFLALYVFFAVKMYQGRNWSRIVLTVLAALTILSVFSASAQVTVDGTVYDVGSSTALRWVQCAIAVIALILMYLGPSNAYFNAVKARRMYVR
ncbi:MAG TPA: hypothetical protein VFM01_13575 [Nakamurella sp.]|nr:hypothetical protein [Nakamurella sp.]